MKKEDAMKSLGLYQLVGQKKYKKLTDYTETEVLEAFQKKCQKLSKNSDAKYCINK